MRRKVAVVLSILVGPTGQVGAHDLQYTYTALILRADGAFQADVTCDLDALALGLAQGTPADQVVARVKALPPADLEALVGRLREQLANQITVRFNGIPVQSTIAFPERGHPPADPTVPTVLGLTARLSGSVPPRAREVSVQVDRTLPPLYLTVIEQRSGRQAQQVLERGLASEPFAMTPRASRRAWLLESLVVIGVMLAALGWWRRARRARHVRPAHQ